jgi:23S rRNA G2445 N2-methylase RlmL
VIIGTTGIERHTFKAALGEYKVVLTTYKELRNVLIDEIADVCGDKVCDIKPYPLGVVMRTTDIEGLTALRTFREMLFLLGKGYLEADPAAAALGVWKTELLEILESFHVEEAPFYFRVDMKSSLKLDKKSLFTRRFAEMLENISGGRLINSTSDYEAEIRLVETKDGRFVPLLKLYTIPMDRFSYRTGQTAGSMHPFLAASLSRLARPYLKENAQILDPFCGVGTMLIERDILIPAGDKYGIDMFGEAIAKARENAAAADKNINFINRNYFDFKHDYLFDEIITDFPLRGKMTTGELDELYGSFFVKSTELLKNNGILILFSCEEGRIKKQLRLHKEYSLLQESCVRGKEQFNLFIIRYSK